METIYQNVRISREKRNLSHFIGCLIARVIRSKLISVQLDHPVASNIASSIASNIKIALKTQLGTDSQIYEGAGELLELTPQLKRVMLNHKQPLKIWKVRSNSPQLTSASSVGPQLDADMKLQLAFDARLCTYVPV